MRVGLILSGPAALAAAVAGLAGPGEAVAAPVELLSHRAAYRLQLQASGESSGVTSVRGGLVVEWRAGCDGAISNQRLSFVASTTEGPGFSYDVRFSSWEGRDRTTLRFTTRTFDDGELADESRGVASLHGRGGAGEVVFALPENERLGLPQGTIFPTEHVEVLVEAARSGRHFLVHDVFDGSGEDGLNRVTAVIGEAAQNPEGERVWPVNLAYYAPDEEQVTPDFQLAFKMTEAGVLHDVVLDYGEFTLSGHLEKLERLAAQTCE